VQAFALAPPGPGTSGILDARVSKLRLQPETSKFFLEMTFK
jgi:hypothetical protein